MSPEQRAGVDRAHAGREQFAAVTGGENDIAVLDLPLARLAAKLADRLNHAGEVAEVVAGEQAPAGVDRHAAAGADAPGLHEGPALALLAEALVLELGPHPGGEAIVELHAIDVGERERGPPACLLPGRVHPHVGG